MRKLLVKQLPYDLTPVAGLALVGHLVKAVQPVLARLDAALPIKGGVANSDIVRSYVGLLAQGKSDFDAIENFRGEAFFKQAPGIGLLPSSPTLRFALDAKASALFDFVPPMIETLLAGQRADYGVLPCGWLPLDVDIFAGWTTSLPVHSEFKTDLDLTRLSSGKFDTNYLVCQLAALAMNILRLIGQRGLLGPDAPVRHSAKRRRIKTVMQELIYRAGRFINSGRRIILGLGANDRTAKAFARVHGELFAACT